MKQKLTLTELKRYQPFSPPPNKHSFPQAIRRFFLSAAYNNLSYKQQNIIKTKYSISYRSYFQIRSIVDHIDKFTNQRYSLSSIQMAVKNSAQKHQLIDWYLFYKVVYNLGKQSKFKHKSQNQHAILIQSVFRNYLRKKKCLLGIQQVQQIRKSLQQKLILQFGSESLKQIQQIYIKRKREIDNILNINNDQHKHQEILNKRTLKEKINFIQLEQLINKKFEMYVERKKIIYLYLRFDLKNIGWFDFQHFKQQVFNIKKQIIAEKPKQYLFCFQKIIQDVRAQMKVLYYSSDLLLSQFTQNFDTSQDQQLIFKDLQRFINQKIPNRYSKYQQIKIFQSIRFKQNLRSLYDSVDFKQIFNLIFKLQQKKNRKKVLKQENQIFYAYKKILFHLVSKCKAKKLDKEGFAKFILNCDPTLKQYNSFFCVYRVFGDLINVQRIKKNCGLSSLAAYLKLRKTDEQYEKIYQDLYQNYPQDFQIPYGKIQQKINLQLQFILDNSGIKPLQISQHQLVNYRQIIKKVLQLDIDIIARAYIHRCISSKFVALYRKVQGNKKKKDLQNAMNFFSKIKVSEEPKQQSKFGKKVKTQKSATSFSQKKSSVQISVPKKIYNSQNLQMARQLLLDVVQIVPEYKKTKTIRKFDSMRSDQDQEQTVKSKVSILKQNSYNFRSNICAVTYDQMMGLIVKGRQVMCLNNGKEQKLNIKIPYRPNIQILTFASMKGCLIVLTSYLTVQIFQFYQKSQYPFKTIKFGKGQSKVYQKTLDNICESRQYGAYPKLLKIFKNCYIVNYTMCQNKLGIVYQVQKKPIQFIQFTQRQHQFSPHLQKMFALMKKNKPHKQVKSKMIHKIIDMMQRIKSQVLQEKQIHEEQIKNNLKQKGQQDLQQFQKRLYLQTCKNSYRQFLQIFQNQQQKLKNTEVLSNYEYLNIMKYFNSINKSQYLKIYLKEELQMFIAVQIPEALRTVVQSVCDYLKKINSSLMNVIQSLDMLKEGYIRIKKFKDYLLKITQQSYLIHQKQIDIYLKNLAIGKHITYENFIVIMTNFWKYRFWQSPYLIVRDFEFIQQYGLLIYTLDGDKRIFVKNIKDNKIVGLLSQHYSVPNIHYVQNKMILLSAESSHQGQAKSVYLKVWRLNEDFILRIHANPPYIIKSFYTLKNCHEKGITSINYSQKSHCIITCSLDSTVKIYAIQNKPFRINQIQRLYSHQSLFLQCLSKRLCIANQGVNLQVLSTFSINKHINQKNFYKYQSTVTFYYIEKTGVKVSSQNKYISIPIKLNKILDNYSNFITKKKQKAIQNYNKDKMQVLLNTDDLSSNLQTNLYNALKRFYIYDNKTQIWFIIGFLQKKGHGSQFINKIFKRYGLQILSFSYKLPVNSNDQKQIQTSQINSKLGGNFIYLSQQDYLQINLKIKDKTNSKGLIDKNILKQIGANYFYGKNQEKFENIINQAIGKQAKTNIAAKAIIQSFKFYKIQNKIQRFYSYLRSLHSFLKNNKIPYWKLFSNQKQNIYRQKFVTSNFFKTKLQYLKFNVDKINLIISFLSNQDKISIFETMHYLKLALQQQNKTSKIFQQNLSAILMNESLILQSKIQQNQKINNNQSQKSLKIGLRSSIKSSINLQKVQQEKQLQQISRKNMIKSSSKQKLSQKRHSKSKSKQKDKDSESASRNLSPSNSMRTFTRQISYSNTKDSTKRQIFQIKRKLNQMMNNQNKNIWELVSSAVPDFMQESIISQEEYFSIFKIMRSHIKLSQKLQLLLFLKNQNNQQLIDLNYFFQLLEQTTNKKIFHGQKYLISYFAQKLCQQNYSIQQGLQIYIFQQAEQLTLQQFIRKCTNFPFKFTHFALRQFQQVLITQNKAGFVKQDILDLIQRIVQKYNLKLQSKSINFIDEVLFKIDRKKEDFQTIFPKVSIVTSEYFIHCVKDINPIYQKQKVVKDFQNIKMKVKQNIRKKNYSDPQSQRSNKSSRSSTKNIQISYNIFKSQLQNILSQARQSTDKERESARKLARILQSKKISLFSYFSTLDHQKRYYLNENQFQTGLTQLGINLSFWKAVNKKYQKRMYYIQLIKYLIDTNILNYKCVDSQLEIAMEKLIKKVIRNFDIEQIYQKMRDKQNTKTNQTTFKSFRQFVLSTSIFNQKQILYLFGAFCNSDQIKNSKFSNDQIIKNQQNQHKIFNYKMFLDVISLYKAQTITKTPQFKLIDYLKKRNISLVNQFQKFMEKNKKNKEIAESLKKKSTLVSKQVLMMFLTQIKAGLTERQLKQVTHNIQSQIQFAFFNQRLEQVYKKGSSCIDVQEANVYLQSIYKKSKQLNVSIQRLFSDFSQQKKGRLSLKNLNQLCQFIQCGLNKIQIKKVFNQLDLQHKGFCTLSEMLQAIDNIRQKFQKQQDEYQLDYIVQKIFNNTQKFILKQSRISLPFERFCNILDKILTKGQCQKIYNKLGIIVKNADITEYDMKTFIQRKKIQINIKNDKKYKELVLNLLKNIRKNDIDTNQMFKYFSNGTQNPLLKSNFLILYQSLQAKSSILDINNLYAYLDDIKSGQITIQRWQQKLGIIDLQNDHIEGTTQELKVFYKVKMFLSEIYLVFIQKMFKTNQIYHFFDKNGNGTLNYQQFWHLIIQLGIYTNQQLQRKVINYLDRTKQKHIKISILIQQLQSCMGKKQKIVLQTKTSFIFKRNESVFKSKYLYFINQLIKKQEFADINQSNQSCITQSDFFFILKRFGLYLAQDQIADIRRNFFAKQNYLYLYPIYFMLKNIFQNSQIQNIEQSKKQLFLRLMKKMIQNKITLKTIQTIKSNDQMVIFLKQLKIFTPIQIQILIQQISLENSTVIDFQKMKFKVRDSYISHSFNISQSIMFVDNDIKKLLRDNLRKIAKFQKNYQLLGHGNKINEERFSQILNKIGLVFTKKQVSKYFCAFSYEKDYIIIQNLLSQWQKNKQESHKIVEQHFQDDQQIQISYKNKKLITQQDIQILQDHIRKSLKFKSTNLYKALQNYFVQNYGFVNLNNLKSFLIEIGYQIKQQKQSKVFQYFVLKYLSVLQQRQIKVKELQKILKIDEEDDSPHQDLSVKNIKSQQLQDYLITSNCIKNILFQLNQRKGELIIWMQNNEITKLNVQYLLEFISTTFENNFSLIELLCSLFPRQFQLEQLYDNINCLIRQQFIFGRYQQVSSKQSLNLFDFIQSKNFIKIYHQRLDIFLQNVYGLPFGQINLHRISFNLVIQFVLSNQHLMMIKSIFKNSKTQENIHKLLEFQQVQPYNHLVISNPGMIIQSQKHLAQKNLILINQKYLALPASRKQQFQHFIRANSTIALPKVFRSKNFYMWEQNMKPIAKGSITFRWKYIPIFCQKILSQMCKLHKVGYSCPHLRFSQINAQSFIQNTVYPCQIDPSGKLIYFYQANLINIEDPYCFPELYNEGRTKVSSKCDSWIFGCLLYEFIWGHPPNSYFVQLYSHLKKRNLQKQFQQVILMKEQPNQFSYRFYNSSKIVQKYEKQFYFSKCQNYRNLQFNINSLQSLRGLFFTLQLLFDKDYKYFKDQFNLLIKLHDVIFQCLQPDPKVRPSIEQIYSRNIFSQKNNFSIYFDNLSEHQSIQYLQENIIALLTCPNIDMGKNALVNNLVESVKNLQNILSNLSLKKINPLLTVPKLYPWPSKKLPQTLYIYTNNLLRNKDSIRQSFCYNIVLKIFMSQILDRIVSLWIDLKETPQKQTQINFVQQYICHILTKLIRMFRTYEFPGVGFMKQLFNVIIKFVFQQKSDFIIHHNFQNDKQQFSSKSKLSSRSYLKLPSISRKRQQFLQFLKSVIYVTGKGNPQYMPICNYLQQYQSISSLFQYFYASISLFSRSAQICQLSINYFRDRILKIYDQDEIDRRQFKVQLLIFKCLKQHKKISNMCWSYFSQYLQKSFQNVEQVRLFKSQIFYQTLSSCLRDPLESIQIKLILLSIVSTLLNSESQLIIQVMNSSVCNVFSQLIRLMIQPPKGLAIHEQYQSLKWKLEQVVNQLKMNFKLSDIVQNIDGGTFVLKLFEQSSLNLSNLSQI